MPENSESILGGFDFLKPICTSNKCRGEANLFLSNPKGVVKPIDRIKKDICLDCGHIVFWSKGKKYHASRNVIKNKNENAFRG